MDPVVSVQKQDFTRNPEKLAKFPGTREETKSHLHRQLLGIWQGLWTSFLESLYVDTTQIWNKWDCWKNSAKSKRRHLCCIVIAIRSKWKLVGRFYGMLHLSAKRHRFIIWWEDALWKTFWRTILSTNQSVCFIGWVSSYYCEGSVPNPSNWKESFTWIVPRIRILRGRNLEGWRTGCRHWGVGNDGRIWNLPEKTQCERGDISIRKRRIYFSNHRWTNQNPWRKAGPENIHLDTAATNSRRSHIDFLGESEGPHDSFPDARWSDKWFLVHVGKLHFPPSRWTKGQTLLAERRIIPYSTEVHWRIQNYSYEFGCQARETHRWWLEYRWVKRSVWFLDRFHTIYSIGRKSSWRIYMVRGEINEKTAYIQARSFMARTLEVNGIACKAEGEAKVV